jgi:hypothetical protein
VVRCHQQAALSDPAQPGTVGCQFLGEHPADTLVVCPLGCWYRKGAISRMLEHVCNPERNLVEGLVHDTIAVVLAEIPPQVEYDLTNDGKELWDSILPLLQWTMKRENFSRESCSSHCTRKPHHH